MQSKQYRNTGLGLSAAFMLSACGGTDGTAEIPVWMSPEVQAAWAEGYEGQGVTIAVVDEHTSEAFDGNLNGSTTPRPHGGWTALQARLIAPRATVRTVDYFSDAGTPLALRSGLNVVNNSYSINAAPGKAIGTFDPLERSTITHAKNGAAVVVKAAGNEGSAIGSVIADKTDVLNEQLTGAPSAIFVGALSANGTTANPASMASYSNFAGSNGQVQLQFLVVGVEAGRTGLSGTSFAAPIVSGYAAILGSKFTAATPSQISNRLLGTARTDTISGYSVSVHGQGEASITRALAPSSLR